MLSDRHLSYQRATDTSASDARLVPRWLSARDDVWLRELVAESRAAGGAPAGVSEARVVDVVAERAAAHGVARRLVEAVWLVERRRWRTRVSAAAPPEKVRRVLFDLAAERDREEAMATAAKELGVSEAELLSALFADRPGARLLVPPDAEASEQDLRERYNLVLVQSLVVRSAEVVAIVRGHARHVVGRAKLLRLMVGLTEAEDGALRVAISGPLALFHDTLKYGRALASWLPVLLTTPAWSLACRVVLGGEAFRLDLDPSAPLARTEALPAAFDSKLEARLDRDLRRHAPAWRIERESAVIRCEHELFYPDFTLVDGQGRRVVVEIAGFWTPAYLAAKRRMLLAATIPFVVCVDARRGEPIAEGGPDVVPYDRFVDVRALIAACEAVLAGERPRARTSTARHWLTVPRSPAMASHAIRLGAGGDSWREDLLADTCDGGQVRIGLELPSQAGAPIRIFLLGRRFLVELTRDEARSDALFACRVLERGRRPLAELRIPVTFALRTPGEETPRADDLGPTRSRLREFAHGLVRTPR